MMKNPERCHLVTCSQLMTSHYGESALPWPNVLQGINSAAAGQLVRREVVVSHFRAGLGDQPVPVNPAFGYWVHPAYSTQPAIDQPQSQSSNSVSSHHQRSQSVIVMTDVMH
ncbi:hypothetical protein BaRGS_00026531 [Batillaria attramentaria]|uniref:Uncharacterized protein n=1 Tax=Batillaria attramentaria TaxID=370345 RepID=A0ABD0K430_9CAEN